MHAAQSQCRDRDHRLPLGARIRPGRGPRPARPLGARGSRARLSGPPARPAAAARISEGAAVRPGAVLQRRQGPDLRERRDRPVYRRAERSAAAARSAGQVSRDPVDLCGAQQRRAGDPQPAADRRLLRRRGMGRSCAGRRRGFRQAEAEARVRLARRQAVARRRPLHHRRPDDGHALRFLRHTDLVAEFPNLAAFEARRSAPRIPARARPTSSPTFREHEPEGEAA